MVQVPAALLGTGDHYALEVSGDSMIDAGILDGDTVLIQRCEQANDGSIVVAPVSLYTSPSPRDRTRSRLPSSA